MGPGETIGLIAVVCLLIGLPWLIFHYITLWKKGGNTLSVEDERLLDELYDLGRKLDERVGTIERIMTRREPRLAPSDGGPRQHRDRTPDLF